MNMVIEATALAKSFGAVAALKPSTFSIPAGQIVGIIGANGAGKTTMLNAILGLSAYQGSLRVLGLEPLRDRATLMENACFIADVATLPRWLTPAQLLTLMTDLHPRFNSAKARARLERANIPMDRKIKTFSKGMVVQAHLAVALAIDARLLVLDEPTLGLDILNRRAFYDAILTDYFDDQRTILITTHQVEEIEHVLTHVMMIREGVVQLYEPVEQISTRYVAVEVPHDKLATAQQFNPIYQRASFGRTLCVFDSPDRARIQDLGDVRRVGLSDVFVALNPSANPAQEIAA